MRQIITPGDLIFFFSQYWTISQDIVETIVGIVLSVHSKTKGYRKNKRKITLYRMITAKGIYNIEHESMANIIVNKLE